jgi:hypothetical protein
LGFERNAPRDRVKDDFHPYSVVLGFQHRIVRTLIFKISAACQYVIFLQSPALSRLVLSSLGPSPMPESARLPSSGVEAFPPGVKVPISADSCGNSLGNESSRSISPNICFAQYLLTTWILIHYERQQICQLREF